MVEDEEDRRRRLAEPMNAKILRLTEERNESREVIKSIRMEFLHKYQHGHETHFVKPKLGGNIIEWAADELAAMRNRLKEHGVDP